MKIHSRTMMLNKFETFVLSNQNWQKQNGDDMNGDACIFWPYIHLMNPPGDRSTPILVSDWPPPCKIY